MVDRFFKRFQPLTSCVEAMYMCCLSDDFWQQFQRMRGGDVCFVTFRISFDREFNVARFLVAFRMTFDNNLKVRVETMLILDFSNDF